MYILTHLQTDVDADLEVRFDKKEKAAERERQKQSKDYSALGSNCDSGGLGFWG